MALFRLRPLPYNRRGRLRWSFGGTLDITVRGQHFEVPDSVEERARQKLGRLDHYLPLLHDAIVEVDIAHQKAKEPDQRYLVRVTVDGGGVQLRTEEHASTPEVAVDQVARVLAGQARRHKQRLYERGRNKGEPAAFEGEIEKTARKVSRVKRFAMKPMTVDEALLEIEALGHEFFVFQHVVEGQVAVLYRRRAGDYGLIMPERP